MLKPNRPLMISLEGNIGAGKTTILEYLATLNNITILNEPIDQWSILTITIFYKRCITMKSLACHSKAMYRPLDLTY